MGAFIYFLLGVLFLAICEWFYLKKFHHVDARHEEPSAVKEKMDTLSETAGSLAGSASASAVSAGNKVMEIPAVSKGRAFLERMAAKEAHEKSDNKDVAHAEASGQDSVVSKQDKSSIKTTKAMAKQVSTRTSYAEKNAVEAAAPIVSASSRSSSRRTGSGQDDLQKVSGIGPKIHQLLQADNINSFDTLAATNVATLSEIMKKAGPRYALADVSSWPEQAKMLSKGEFEALEMLQQSLKKG